MKLQPGGFLVLLGLLALHVPAEVSAQTTCQGQTATIVGTEGSDVLDGSDGVDVIAAGDGDDIVYGRRGPDVICGGRGDDILYGNGGRDLVQGNKGNDLVYGNGGDDELRGGKDNDTIDGGPGTNECYGGAGLDFLTACAAIPTPQPTPSGTAQPTPQPTPSSPGEEVPANFEGVVWLHSDVSDWPVTTGLDVSIDGSLIRIPYDKADVWPANGEGLNGNPWIFVYQDDTWYAATWEWLRFGQTAKNKSSVAGDHIKKAPLQDFRPESGVVYGFMVSGLARTSERNVEERSEVVMFRWP